MAELSILFGRPRAALAAEDRFELEVLAAEELGIESFAIPLDEVVAGEPEQALRRLPRPRGAPASYRQTLASKTSPRCASSCSSCAAIASSAGS